MKLFNSVAWISGLLAVAIMMLGCISFILGNNLLGVRHEANFFIVANSLFLLAILCVLAQQGCGKKELSRNTRFPAFSWRYRIVSVSAPRITPENSPKCQGASPKYSVHPQCFNGIRRTGWNMPATVRQ